MIYQFSTLCREGKLIPRLIYSVFYLKATINSLALMPHNQTDGLGRSSKYYFYFSIGPQNPFQPQVPHLQQVLQVSCLFVPPPSLSDMVVLGI